MKKITEEILNKYKKRNRKLFVLYKMLANDLLFYYTISYLFLSNIKGLSTSQIVFADSFYPLSKLILQIPCTILIQKIGKRNSLLIGNTGIAIYLISVLFLNSTVTYIIANIFCALGFVIKGIAESNFLYDSLDNSQNTDEKNNEFSNIEGKASSRFFFIDAITALATGFLYIANPYLPILLSISTIFLSLLVCLAFREIPNEKNSSLEDLSAMRQLSIHLKDTYQGFKCIIKSSRLRALILFNSLFASLIILMVTIHRSILDDVNVSSKYLGIIFALMGLVVSFSSTRSHSLHKKYHNKTLALLGLILTLSIIFTGLVTIINLPKFAMYYLLLIMITLTYIVKGPFYILIKQYLNSFCDSNMRIKIYSANLLLEYISTTTISMCCSYLLTFVSSSVAALIIGIVSFTLMIFLIFYMSSRVGLKPEEYSEKDILFIKVD